jgi:DnaJ-class molecular chaperone
MGGFHTGPMGGDMNDMFNMMFGGGFPGMGGMGGFPGGPNVRVFHSGGRGFPGQVHMNGFPSGIEQLFQQIHKPQPIHKHIHITLEQVYTGLSVPIEIERQCNRNNITSQDLRNISAAMSATSKQITKELREELLESKEELLVNESEFLETFCNNLMKKMENLGI